MIQRIQSLYLLISSLLLSVSLFAPYMSFEHPQTEILLTAWSISDTTEGLLQESQSLLSLSIAVISTAVLSMVVIFLFKNRTLQMRLIRYAVMLKIAILAAIAFFSYMITALDEKIVLHLEISILFVLIAIVVDVLAYMAVKKDDNLVRSIDRIR